MDFGFFRGKSTIPTEKGPLVTNKDGYNCYLLVADEFSWRLWVFLFANKKPPVDTIVSFINTHVIKTGLRIV